MQAEKQGVVEAVSDQQSAVSEEPTAKSGKRTGGKKKKAAEVVPASVEDFEAAAEVVVDAASIAVGTVSAEELPANFGALDIGPQRLRPRLVIEAGQPGAIQALVAALPLLGVPEREAEKIVREFELYARS